MGLGLEDKLTIFGGLIRSRTFSEYRNKLLNDGVNILDEVILRLKNQERAVFYDFGCGFGMAGDDLFPIVKDSLLKRGENPSIADRLTYIGIDFLEPEQAQTESKILIRYDLEKINEIMDKLPKIDVGICFWVFPYLERKMEALESWAKYLNRNGIIVISPFYDDLTIINSDRSKPVSSSEVYTRCFNASQNHNTVVVRGVLTPVEKVVVFRDSSMYHNTPYVKGSRFPQMLSVYDLVPTPS